MTARRGVRSVTRQRMTHRVQLLTDAVDDTGAVDSYGHPLRAGSRTPAPEIPGWAWESVEQANALDGSAQAAVAVVRVLVPVDTVARTGDIIEAVRDRIGRVVFPGPMHITGVVRRADHLVLTARVVTHGRA